MYNQYAITKEKYMINLQEHPFFTPFTDPLSGIKSYVLTKRIAPIQQTFYFTNPNVSQDGRYLWIVTGFPPNLTRTLAAVDLEKCEIHHFPQAPVESEVPRISSDGTDVLFTVKDSVYKMNLFGEVKKIMQLPQSFVRNRLITRLSTHLSITCDQKYMILDGAIGNHWFLALGELDTGNVEVIKEFRMHHNHAQASPTDPDIIEIAQDHFKDPNTGEHFHYDQRMWILNKKATRFEPLRADNLGRPYLGICHEFFSQDGWLCYVDYEYGARELNINTREDNPVWEVPLCHVHCNKDRTEWVADESPYFWTERPCQVRYFDRNTKTEINIFSAMLLPKLPREGYHVDPHPQFVFNDQWIVSTTTVLDGNIDVAITPVENCKKQLHKGRRL